MDRTCIVLSCSSLKSGKRTSKNFKQTASHFSRLSGAVIISLLTSVMKKCYATSETTTTITKKTTKRLK